MMKFFTIRKHSVQRRGPGKDARELAHAKRWRAFAAASEFARRLGVRQSSGAFLKAWGLLQLRLLLVSFSIGFLISAIAAAELPSFPAPTKEQAHSWYVEARSNYLAQVGNTTSAWQYAEACFEWTEFATNNFQRAQLAEEGIAAARFSAEMDPDDPAAHFYLAMNKGQLARTKSLGALPLVKEMEESFRRSIGLDPRFNYASAHRSLGMLYLEAPGWPASIGDKSRARAHLERAVDLVPGYPTNHLELMNALLRWRDSEALRDAMTRYRRILPEARETYSGSLWENSWRNWDREWQSILEKSRSLSN